jgi:hypothetical protein
MGSVLLAGVLIRWRTDNSDWSDQFLHNIQAINAGRPESDGQREWREAECGWRSGGRFSGWQGRSVKSKCSDNHRRFPSATISLYYQISSRSRNSADGSLGEGEIRYFYSIKN